MNKHDAIVILGSTGLVGSSLYRVFKSLGYNNIFCPKRNIVNLMNQGELKSFLDKIESPKYVINAGGKVGGAGV